jgi:hypothetical protein
MAFVFGLLQVSAKELSSIDYANMIGGTLILLVGAAS